MDSSQTSTSNATIAQYANLLTTHLEFTRPKGLKQAYTEAQTSPETSTERIFLDTGGLTAWFAYFFTKRAAKGKTHFEGQAACDRMLKSLESISTDDRKVLAQKVYQLIPEVTKTKIQDLFANSHDLVPSKRCRHTNDDGGWLRTSIPRPASADSIPRLASANSEAIHGEDSVRFNASDPSVHRLKDVFPSSLAGSVRRFPPKSGAGPWTAAITMSFVHVGVMGNRLGSMMSLEIASNKARRYASILFGVELEIHGNFRYIILPNGTKINPCPEFILRGSRRSIIMEEFGADASKSLEACQSFKDEVDQGIQVTDCVTMTISNKVEDGAFINLYLDDKESLRLKEKLYE